MSEAPDTPATRLLAMELATARLMLEAGGHQVYLIGFVFDGQKGAWADSSTVGFTAGQGMSVAESLTSAAARILGQAADAIEAAGKAGQA